MQTTVYFISLVFTGTQLRPAFNGTETIAFLGPKIQDLVPLEIKQKEAVNIFKNMIMTWNTTSCPCILCKCHTTRIGFI